MPLPLPFPGAFSRGAGGALAGVGYELWVIAGQSNAVSFGENTSAKDFPSGALQVSRNGSAAGSTTDNDLIAAAHPLDNVPISGRNNAYHFADKFTIDWQADAANAGKTIVFLPCAEGGTSIADDTTWSPVTTVGARLADMVSRINTFFANYPGATMGGFLWHQGESTVDATYSLLFERMRAYVIANCARVSGSTPWVCGGNAGDTSSFPFNSQKVFPDTIPYTGFASSAGTTSSDGLHFGQANLDTMGERYYAAAVLAAANNDVDLGTANSYGFVDLNIGSYSNQRCLATAITDGFNFRLNSGETLVRRAWRSIPAAGYFAWTSYRVTFTAERDDVTDIVAFSVGTALGANNLGNKRIEIDGSTPLTVDTPTELELIFSTRNIDFSGGIFFSVVSTGPTETNVKITNVRFTRTIEE